jgi:hypothetical protein
MTKRSKFPETQTVAVLSTAHIRLRDANLLEAIIDGLQDPQTPLSILSDCEFGYWIYTGSEITPSELREFGFSVEFAQLLWKVSTAGFTWLRLDCDGLVAEDFPTFEWLTIREDVVARVAKQFKAIFAAQLNGDTRALQCLVNGLKFGIVGKLGAHAAELIQGAEKLGFKMSKKATYDYLFNRPLDLADDEFFIFGDDGNLKRMPSGG